MDITRRVFITTVSFTPMACGIPLSYEGRIPVPQPKLLPAVRPATGGARVDLR